jgi:glycosyltransferase involved in cell wall biosynthesis
MEKCGISVILPSLNVVDYIEECLKSVVNQTKMDIEIICVDAGSEDGTCDIIGSYAVNDARIKVIHSDKKSYGYQMNLGIKAAKGKYIGIVETDDYIDSDMFSVLYRIAEDNDVDFVKTGYISFFDDDGERQYSQIQSEETKTILGEKLYLDNNPKYRLADRNHIWSAIYRRDYLINNGLWFNETEGASYQDTSFSILVGLTAKSCVYSENYFYYYRTDREEASSNSKSKITCVIDEMSYVDKYLNSHQMDTLNNRILVNTAKLNVYLWNLFRLDDGGKDIFITAIKDEMDDFLPNGKYYPLLTEAQHGQVKFLTDYEAAKIFQKRREDEGNYVRKIVEYGVEVGGYIIAGAGLYYERFVELQNICNYKFIYAVCENSKELQGHEKCGYTILSVEAAVKKYKDKNWLILNKKYADDIKIQLCELGVDGNNINEMKICPNKAIQAQYLKLRRIKR